MDVIVYSTPDCPSCRMVRDFLNQQKVAFREVDVSRDMEMAKELIRKSGQRGVPVTDVDGQIFIGFQPERIAAALKAGTPKAKA